MAYRTVYKIAGSLGPGGSVPILTEKICRQFFYEAYEQADPSRADMEQQDNLMKEQRAAYVQQLFDIRGTFERKSQSLNESTKDEGYTELAEVIEKHAKIFIKTQKGLLLRERIFYKHDPNRYN